MQTTFIITAFQMYYKMLHYIPDASALLLIFLFPFFHVDLLLLDIFQCISSQIF